MIALITRTIHDLFASRTRSRARALEPRIAAVGRALPPHRYEQDELIAAARALWQGKHRNTDRIDSLQKAVQVGGRNLALPLEQYLGLDDFTKSNDAYIRAATELGAEAMRRALQSAGLTPRDVDAIFFTTVTGIATPTIDARLINRLGMRADVKRTPMFGLGCVAGAAGVARMADYLRGHPDDVAVLLSVELCSLTLQREDFSVANLIATGLFGDGAAAVVGVGGRAAETLSARGGASETASPLPRVVASRSNFYPDTERVMGWDVGAAGFKIVLSAGVPDVARKHIAPDVDRFLAERGLERKDIDHWICHPGGPKVLEAFEEGLELPRERLEVTWRSLREVGNLSSASVLFVLEDTLAERRPQPGQKGLMIAMGPGFCSELVLVEW